MYGLIWGLRKIVLRTEKIYYDYYFICIRVPRKESFFYFFFNI